MVLDRPGQSGLPGLPRRRRASDDLTSEARVLTTRPRREPTRPGKVHATCHLGGLYLCPESRERSYHRVSNSPINARADRVESARHRSLLRCSRLRWWWRRLAVPAMYPKADEASRLPAAGVPINNGPGAYYQGPAGGATAAFAVQAQPPVAAWSTGLCNCFDDCGNCCVTCLCPCITFGKIAEIVDRGSTSCGASGALYALISLLTCCHCVYSCFYRAKMRAQYGLRESPCPDFLVHCFCEQCALCQEYRELKKRGFDMNIGWHANMERQGRTAATMPPQMHPGMTR